MSTTYYLLSTKTKNPASPDPQWFAQAQGSLLCKGCCSPRATTHAVDVVLQRLPDDSALNFVQGVCVAIATVPFLRALLPEGPEKYLYLGKVFDSEKSEVPAVLSVMGHKTVLIRGGEKSSFRVCQDCGRVWYSPVGKRYVLKRDVGETEVLDAWFGSLVVSEVVAQRLTEGKWKNLVVQKLEVRDEPVDGLDIPL